MNKKISVSYKIAIFLVVIAISNFAYVILDMLSPVEATSEFDMAPLRELVADVIIGGIALTSLIIASSWVFTKSKQHPHTLRFVITVVFVSIMLIWGIGCIFNDGVENYTDIISTIMAGVALVFLFVHRDIRK